MPVCSIVQWVLEHLGVGSSNPSCASWERAIQNHLKCVWLTGLCALTSWPTWASRVFQRTGKPPHLENHGRGAIKQNRLDGTQLLSVPLYSMGLLTNKCVQVNCFLEEKLYEQNFSKGKKKELKRCLLSFLAN